MTTYIHRYWLDPGSRGQSVYAANLQDKDNLSAARDLKLFYFEVALCTLKKKKDKNAV